MNGLVGYWACEEASGNLVASYGSIPNLIAALISYHAIGKNNYGVDFGTNLSSAVLGNANSRLYTDPKYDKISISCWVKFNNVPSVSGHRQDLVVTAHSLGNFYSFTLRVNTSDQLEFYTTDINGATAGGPIAAVTLTTVPTYHFIAIARGIGTKPRIFINGTGYDTAGNDQLTSILVPDSTFCIGNQYDGASRHADAIMDEIALYHRDLSDGEAADLYNGGTGLFYPATFN